MSVSTALHDATHFHTLQNVRIAAVRASLPTQEINLEDEKEFYGGSVKKIKRLKSTIGMDRRRVVHPDVTASDLCAHAADNLLRAHPDARDTVDALVFVSQTPDWRQPATACELQHRLGLPHSCAAFDVNQGCTGYVYGLWISSSLIASAAVRKVLLLVGDAFPIVRDPRNRIMTPVFGDAGSATLLVRDEKAPPVHFGLGTDGSDFESVIVPAGGARIPHHRDMPDDFCLYEDIPDQNGNIWRLLEPYMDGGAVFNFTMDVVPEHIRQALAYANATPESIDWLILHQANKQIIEGISAQVDIANDKAPWTPFSKYGNTASSSIPVALCDTLGSIRAPGGVLMCGYGIGLSWGSCLWHINDWDCTSPLGFEPDPNRKNRQQKIERWQRILRGEQSRHE